MNNYYGKYARFSHAKGASPFQIPSSSSSRLLQGEIKTGLTDCLLVCVLDLD